MGTAKILLVRLVLSGAFGFAVALVPLYLMLGDANSDGVGSSSYQREQTRYFLKKIDRYLADYKQHHKAYPPDLQGLSYPVRDSWGHSFHYSLRQGKPLVESFGLDGKRGGWAWDADLSNQNPHPSQGYIPFWLRLISAPRMTSVALLCGFGAALLAFHSFRDYTFAPSTYLALAVEMLLCFAIAAFGALCITFAHIPSGH